MSKKQVFGATLCVALAIPSMTVSADDFYSVISGRTETLSPKLDEITSKIEKVTDRRIKSSRKEGKYPQTLFEKWQQGDLDALTELYHLAKQRDKHAQTIMGYMLDNGLGFPSDSHEAFLYFASAAPLGVELAQYNLGVLYMYGRGVNQNADVALDWFSKAKKYPPAFMQIANYAMSLNDTESALIWAQKAAKANDKDGLYLSGRLLLQKGDLVEGFSNINKAARLSQPDAIASMAALYMSGIGTEKDIGMGIGWWVIDQVYLQQKNLEEVVLQAQQFDASVTEKSKGIRHARRFLLNRNPFSVFDYTKSMMFEEYKGKS